MKMIWDKCWLQFMEIKSRFFGKKKSTDKITEPITNTGLNLLHKVHKTIEKEGIKIEGYNSQAEYYYSNGNWYINVNGVFLPYQITEIIKKHEKQRRIKNFRKFRKIKW